ncbi:Fido domain-containing protein [Stylophora pistillata]|uniref:Fido domain-containing protein n=1 Tax=Stylophora pistillata TaxID=50429 RepID=A0A2B4REQ6_STYPI|nr:Fido domain-containing protein [Stylophora pistillata]
MSNKARVTEFKGEIYHYANPDDMESAVINLLDKYNFLYDSCFKEKGGRDEDIDVYSLFKTCSWILFELLDLHPFSDGNGRLCRILCSYSLSELNPFPTPIYNVWRNSCKGDYIEALVEARMSPDRHPSALTTMIIECSYYGWEKFFKALQGSSEESYAKENSRKYLAFPHYSYIVTPKDSTFVVSSKPCQSAQTSNNGDFCIIDNVGRQTIVVEWALFFRSAVTKAFVFVVVVVRQYFLIMFVNDRSHVLHTAVADLYVVLVE